VGFAMDAGIVFVHLVYFMDMWHSFWLFGIFFPFWYVAARTIAGSSAPSLAFILFYIILPKWLRLSESGSSHLWISKCGASRRRRKKWHWRLFSLNKLACCRTFFMKPVEND
jgi:hypothetical protein